MRRNLYKSLCVWVNSILDCVQESPNTGMWQNPTGEQKAIILQSHLHFTHIVIQQCTIFLVHFLYSYFSFIYARHPFTVLYGNTLPFYLVKIIYSL